MKRFILATFIFMAVSAATVWAQQPADISALSKEQKELIKLQQTLEKDREKLERLYLDRDVLIAEKNKKHKEAVSAANKNTKTARNLSKEVDSKNKAKKAQKAAKKAESKAKSASKADSRVAKNEEQIQKLEKSIQKNEAKLRKMETKISGN